MAKRQYKRRNFLGKDGEVALIRIWRKRLFELRTERKKRRIYQEIVDEMKLEGIDCNYLEVKCKMHNLSSKYRRERAIVASRGVPSEWHLYSEMDNLLGSCENFYTETPMEDSRNDTWSPCTDSPTQSLPSPSPDSTQNFRKDVLARLGKIESQMEKFNKEMTEYREELRKTTCSLLEAEKTKRAILEEFVKGNKEVSTKLLEFLKEM